MPFTIHRAGARQARRRAATMIAAAACAAAALAAPAAAGASTWVVTGPQPSAERGPQAVVRLDDAAGTLSLEVTRGGATVLEPSPLGIVTERSDLSTGLRFLERSDRRVAEHYTTTVGKQLERQV